MNRPLAQMSIQISSVLLSTDGFFLVFFFFVVPLLPSPSLACYLQGFLNITSHMTSSQVSKQPHQCYQASGQRARSTERQCSEKNSLDLPGANMLGNLLWSTQQIFKEEKSCICNIEQQLSENYKIKQQLNNYKIKKLNIFYKSYQLQKFKTSVN